MVAIMVAHGCHYSYPWLPLWLPMLNIEHHSFALPVYVIIFASFVFSTHFIFICFDLWLFQFHLFYFTLFLISVLIRKYSVTVKRN